MKIPGIETCAGSAKEHLEGVETVARVLALSLGLSVGSLGVFAEPADWPQLGGPGRDYAPPAPTLATQWPAGGPRVIWERELGLGYSGISIVDDDLYTMYREGEDEIVLAADAATGETRWEHRYAAPFAPHMRMEHGTGPHTTPLVTGDLVVTVGIRGTVFALDRESGEEEWRVELVEDLGGTKMDRGYSSSPLAHHEWIILPVGGRGQGIVAFDRETGEIAWKNQDFAASYSSPRLIEVNGQRQLVYLTREQVVGLGASSGELLWAHDHPCMYGLNVSTPLWSEEDQLLFVSSAYDGGSRVLKLRRESDGGSRAWRTVVDELWAHKQMRLHIGNALRVGDWVVASNGDFGPVPFTAVNVKSGEVGWRSREVSRAFQVLADGKLILLDEDGVLYLATASPQGLEIHARHELFSEKTWTPPTLVGRHLYARDTARMVALELP